MRLRVVPEVEAGVGNLASVIHDGNCCPITGRAACLIAITATRFTDIGTSRWSALNLAAFRIDAKNRYIPRVWRYFPNSLALEGNADKLGSMPVLTVAEKSECAIEITSAHADSVPLTVECNQWSDHDIKFTYVDTLSGNRLPKTEVIHREFRLRHRFPKLQMALRTRYWQENAFFCAPCALDYSTRIYLVPGRHVAPNRIAAHEIAAIKKAVCDLPGSLRAFARGQRPTRFSCVDPQVLHRGRWVDHR